MISNLLEVIGVTKEFDLFSSEKDLFVEMISFGLITRSKKKMVLKDVSLNLAAGESVRIIGENGKGKSTLLRIIAGALSPDSGRVIVRGSVGAILDLGAGIYPEITGRQNAKIYYYKLDVRDVVFSSYLDSVFMFSSLGEYYDLPVKYYSSGMAARLAFSMAMMIRPDIIIIDEALSVGDGEFQKKCIGLIKDYLSKGSALLYVSHAENSGELFDITYKLVDGKLLVQC